MGLMRRAHAMEHPDLLRTAGDLAEADAFAAYETARSLIHGRDGPDAPTSAGQIRGRSVQSPARAAARASVHSTAHFLAREAHDVGEVALRHVTAGRGHTQERYSTSCTAPSRLFISLRGAPRSALNIGVRG
jgi:hypothetical protein